MTFSLAADNWRQQVNYGRGGRTLHSLRRSKGQKSDKAGAGFLLMLLALAVRRDGQSRRQPLFNLLVLESPLAILVGNLRQRGQAYGAKRAPQGSKHRKR